MSSAEFWSLLDFICHLFDEILWTAVFGLHVQNKMLRDPLHLLHRRRKFPTISHPVPLIQIKNVVEEVLREIHENNSGLFNISYSLKDTLRNI